MVAPGDEGT